jgi:hypothetical protein
MIWTTGLLSSVVVRNRIKRTKPQFYPAETIDPDHLLLLGEHYDYCCKFSTVFRLILNWIIIIQIQFQASNHQTKISDSQNEQKYFIDWIESKTCSWNDDVLVTSIQQHRVPNIVFHENVWEITFLWVPSGVWNYRETVHPPFVSAECFCEGIRQWCKKSPPHVL